ncbi:hypothetical protein LWE61_20045 [Sphingobium sufflavum]|uniref:DUF7940 domain-containing protein n=1 Tax=Sphingobium sufflavum TaxID=1129547 RepID=UPI001F2963FB|nr:hypothetical protein [Sphingobium sufflavum]MCE7798824.1 hypothetical protein [Sphingobium sufflavum]
MAEHSPAPAPAPALLSALTGPSPIPAAGPEPTPAPTPAATSTRTPFVASASAPPATPPSAPFPDSPTVTAPPAPKPLSPARPPRARLIPGWTSAWRLWSVRLSTLGAGLMAAWSSLPADLRGALPYADRVAAALFLAVTAARLVAQEDGARRHREPAAAEREDRA